MARNEIPSGDSRPTGVAVSGDRNVWFTETITNKIRVLAAGSSTIREFTIGTKNSCPEDIRIIAGRVIFSERHGGAPGEMSVPGLTH